MPEIEEISKKEQCSFFFIFFTLVVIVISLFVISLLALSVYIIYFIFNVQQWTELLEKKIEYIIKALTVAGLISGGIIGGINLYFGAKRAFAMEKSAEAANRTAEAALKNAEAANKTAEVNFQNARLSEDKQITERFSKAIEQLGSEKIEVRLGGIYTLERIATDSSKDHWTVMEVLTAFIREKAQFKEYPEVYDLPIFDKYLDSQEQKEEQKLKYLMLDIQEALTVIGRRNYKNELEYQKLNLRNINIYNANLYKAHLAGSEIIGSNLYRANLAEADLTMVNISEANLAEADLTLTNFTKSYLMDANLTQARLYSTKFTGANLTGANLSGAGLYRVNFAEASLFRANLKGINFKETNLYRANLESADLTGSNFIDNKTIEPNQIKKAKNWDKAKYDKEFCQKLGLLPENAE